MEWILLILGLLVIFVLAGCKKPNEEPVEGIKKVLLYVPYEKAQGKNWCLPASGTMILKYYGENVTQKNLAKIININSIFKLIKYARELGYEAKFRCIKIEEIEGYLRKEIPLIAVQKYSLSIPDSHCRVIIGFDNKKAELILHDPAGRSNYKMSYKNFFELGANNEMTKIIMIRR